MGARRAQSSLPEVDLDRPGGAARERRSHLAGAGVRHHRALDHRRGDALSPENADDLDGRARDARDQRTLLLQRLDARVGARAAIHLGAAARLLDLSRLARLGVGVVAAAELDGGEDEDAHEGGRRRDLGGDQDRASDRAERPPRVAALGKPGESLPAYGLRKIEQRRGAERVAARLEPAYALRARAAGDQVLDDVTVRVGRKLLLDVREQLEIVRMLLGHHRFDSVGSAGVPRRSASSLRPRKIRDFTVPSGTSVSSAISA